MPECIFWSFYWIAPYFGENSLTERPLWDAIHSFPSPNPLWVLCNHANKHTNKEKHKIARPLQF